MVDCCICFLSFSLISSPERCDNLFIGMIMKSVYVVSLNWMDIDFACMVVKYDFCVLCYWGVLNDAKFIYADAFGRRLSSPMFMTFMWTMYEIGVFCWPESYHWMRKYGNLFWWSPSIHLANSMGALINGLHGQGMLGGLWKILHFELNFFGK